jgi:hypothetical protein
MRDVRRVDPNPVPMKINSKRGRPHERKPSAASLFSEEDGNKIELDLDDSGKKAPLYLC